MDGPSTDSDRHKQAILEALKQAAGDATAEHRLFRAGKFAGLFASRHGTAHAAATLALQLQLLETTRTEVKGKTTTEWVRLTPAGVEYLHHHENPQAVFEELLQTLRTTREGVPLWLEQVRSSLDKFTQQCTEQVQQLLERLDQLESRVTAALRRAESERPELSATMTDLVPWGLEALTYLDQRQEAGIGGDCPLPELFHAIARNLPELTLGAFHDGLRRLAIARAVRLSPPEDAEAIEPEYALLDGGHVLYRAGR